MEGENLTDLYNRTRDATLALHARAAEMHELAVRIEYLTQHTPAWHAGTRAIVEVRAGAGKDDPNR
jgi:hypothetical protein